MGRFRSRSRAPIGALRSSTQEAPPGDGYTFPTTEYTFPAYPDDGGTPSNTAGIANVKDYGAVGNGSTDDTAAIQDCLADNGSLDETAWPTKTIFFPNGTYKVTGLGSNGKGIIERRSSPTGWRGGLRIQGETKAGAIIKLADNSLTTLNHPTYGLPDPKFIIYQSSWNEGGPHVLTDGTGLSAYQMWIQDLTIDLGDGNIGAAGVNVMMHNGGVVRRVKVIGGSDFYCGFAAERFGSGPSHVHRIEVDGGKYGVRVATKQGGFVIEHLKLSNQSVLGIDLNGNQLVICGLEFDGTVPVADITSDVQNHHADPAEYQNVGWVHTKTNSEGANMSNFTLLRAVCTGSGGASSVSAIKNSAYSGGGKMFLRDVNTSGFAQAAEESGTPVQSGAASITEYGTPPLHNLWEEATTSLNIEIKDTPEAPWPAIGSMTNVEDYDVTPNSGNILARLQDAIDSSPTDTLYFPPKAGTNTRYTIAGTLYLRANVRRIIGGGNYLYGVTTSPPDDLTFNIDVSGTGEPVVLEQLNFWGLDIFTVVNTPRDVIFKTWEAGILSNTSAATGTVYFDDAVNGLFIDFDYSQDVYIRHWDIEGGGVLSYVGGNLWVLYSKTERVHTCFDIQGGNFEHFGSWLSPVETSPGSTVPLFKLANCNAAINMMTHESDWGGGTWTVLIEETQGATTRKLLRSGNTFTTDPDPRGSGRHVVMFRSKHI